jgi:hypothetical protein
MKVKKKSTALTTALETIQSFPEKRDGKPISGLRNFWDMTEDGLTQSMLGLFALCPQKAHYKLIEGIEIPRRDRALDFGTFFHEVLDKVYTAQKENNTLPNYGMIGEQCYKQAKARLIEESTDIKDLQEFEVNYGVCQTLLRHYFNKWTKEDKYTKWVDLERVFEFPYKLRDGTVVMIRGKFDGIFRDKKGNVWLFETKTKSNITGNHIMEKMAFDLQVMVYLKAVEYVYKVKPAGVLYNLVKRPNFDYKGTYYKKPETVPAFLERVSSHIDSNVEDYFTRYHVSITKQEVETFFLQDLDYLIQRMYEWQQGGISNFRNSGACSMWNRPCEYLPICSSGDRSNYRKRKEIFPELTEGVNE